MTVARIAVSLDAELAKAVRRAAGKEPISAWVADALERKLRSEGLLRVVAEFERENGPFTEAELRAAEETLRRRPVKRRRPKKNRP
jgi:hypothetical protein